MLSLNRTFRFAVAMAAVLAIAAPAASARPADWSVRHQQALFDSPASDVLTPLGPTTASARATDLIMPSASQQLPPDRADRIGSAHQAPIRFQRVVGVTNADTGFDWQIGGLALAAIMGSLGLTAAAMSVRGRRVATS